MTRVEKKDLKVGEFYFCPLSKRTVQVTQKTSIGTTDEVVMIRMFDDIYKTLTLNHDLFVLSKFEKLFYRGV